MGWFGRRLIYVGMAGFCMNGHIVAREDFEPRVAYMTRCKHWALPEDRFCMRCGATLTGRPKQRQTRGF